MKTGDKITITCAGRTVPGTVMFASENGKSLVINFEAILGFHAGTMAVLQNDDGSYCAVLTGMPLSIELDQARLDDQYKRATELGHAIIDAFPLLRFFPLQVGQVIGIYHRMADRAGLSSELFFADMFTPRGIMYLAGGCYAALQKNPSYGFDG